MPRLTTSPATKADREWLAKVGEYLYGYGWQTRMAEDLHVDETTVRRWVGGRSALPGPVRAALTCFVSHKRNHFVKLSAAQASAVAISSLDALPDPAPSYPPQSTAAVDVLSSEGTPV